MNCWVAKVWRGSAADTNRLTLPRLRTARSALFSTPEGLRANKVEINRENLGS
jgi:hypothetical protein